MQEDERQSPLHHEVETAHHLHIEELYLREKEHVGTYDIDMMGWDDDEVDHEEHHGEQDVPAHVDAHTITLEKPTRNPLFVESYMKSIQPARDTIRGQWNECKWDNKYLNKGAPATFNEAHALPLKKRCPSFLLCTIIYAPTLY